MSGEILADLHVHAVNLREELGYSRVIVRRVGLRAAQMGGLSLEARNAFQSDVQFLVVRNHGEAEPSVSEAEKREAAAQSGSSAQSSEVSPLFSEPGVNRDDFDGPYPMNRLFRAFSGHELLSAEGDRTRD